LLLSIQFFGLWLDGLGLLGGATLAAPEGTVACLGEVEFGEENRVFKKFMRLGQVHRHLDKGATNLEHVSCMGLHHEWLLDEDKSAKF